MRLSDRVKAVSPSMTLAITARIKALKAKGESVINFGAGEPDLPTPDFVCKAGKEAIDKGLTRYTPATGMPQLKEAVCRRFERVNGLSYRPSQVLISCGAKHSLYNIIQTLVNPGDGVLVPLPYWVSYPEMVKLAGGRVIFVETREDDGFCLEPEALVRAIEENPSAKLLILNYPSNPTGAVYSKDRLLEIADVCRRYDLAVISDEIYDILTYDSEHISFASLSDDAYQRTITINGVSKAYSMTGWRIGFAAGNEEVIKAAGSIQSHSTSNPTTISQYASISALDGGAQWEDYMKDVYSKRANLLMELFNGLKLARVFPPKGTFYAFVNISEYGMGSLAFAEKMLDEIKVGVIPGIAFGADEWVRVSFATSEEDIIEGIKRWQKWEEGFLKG